MESIPNDLMNGCTKVAFQWRPMKQNRKDVLTGHHPRIGWLLHLHYHWHHPPVKRSCIGADAPLPPHNACMLHYNIPGGLVKTARLCSRSCQIDAQSVFHLFLPSRGLPLSILNHRVREQRHLQTNSSPLVHVIWPHQFFQLLQSVVQRLPMNK